MAHLDFPHPEDSHVELQLLRERVAALEELLDVYERETMEKSVQLEQSLSELQGYARQLSCSESALQELKSILNSMGEGVVVADNQGQLLFVNPVARAHLGFAADERSLQAWANRCFTNLFFQADGTTPCALEQFPLMRAIAGESVNAAELYLASSQSEAGMWLSVTARPIYDDQHQLQGGVAVFHNMTSHKQSEEALRHSEARSRQQAEQLKQAITSLHRTQAQLIQTEKMSSLGQLVAGIAHEINNPISFIYGNLSPAEHYSRDLLDLLTLFLHYYPQPPAEIQEKLDEVDLKFVQKDFGQLLQSMRMGTERIQRIVLSLRNFARLDEAEMKQVNIHDGINNTLMILQHRFREEPNKTEVQLIRNFADLPSVECYAGQLNQAIMNIVSNALDALDSQRSHPTSDGQPTITITTEMVNDSAIAIRILNNGPSIPPKQHARLFDPFFTTKPLGKGTGLGLYTSYQIIVERHRGQLSCISNPEHGTEFCLEIPVSPTAQHPNLGDDKTSQPEPALGQMGTLKSR
ncbi:PAS domain-containing sensor histidine kinase [Leptolyngbya sp. AN02str]|uniref:PAS domain-containing sensor histidine kinase n=1 Tax=Leptolyngbya sp. AN02str TaxID=3423363 RepID=UPI003D319B64